MRKPAFAPLLLLMTMSQASAANYTARKVVVDGIEVAQLADAARAAQVSIAPALGNMAYEFRIAGKNVLYLPYASLTAFKQRPGLCGIPFLAPWANRLDADGYWANGKRYALNPALGNVRRDNYQHPIHGLLGYTTEWTLVSLTAGDHEAVAVSRLEFWKRPEMMAQFPFAHTLTMTYRLANGELEVETAIENHSAEPMPVAIGYHPYFHLDDAPRDQWHMHLAARDRLTLSDRLIPTGERQPVRFADPLPLQGASLDDVFSNLIRGADGRAEFWVAGARQRIAVLYGPKYNTAVVYAPPGREFICFEPMAAITDAFNLAHSGAYGELQSVAPGARWRESFWIRPSGFQE